MAGSDWLLHDAMQEARRENLTYGLRHIAFNPAEPMTDDQLAEFAGRICHEFHADPEHITLVIHQKDGSTHGHLLLPEWQQDHILDSRFSWIRLEKLARLEEIRLGHALVVGRHDRSIAKALRQDGKHREAEQIDALIPEQPADKPRAAYTSQSHRMAKRQGLDLPKLKHLVDCLWSQSDGLKSFRAALAEHRLTMREGDRKGTRPGAYIIETSDGTLIGSFTRLTKVRIAEFRMLLAEENQRAARKPETNIKGTRLPFRRTKDTFYDEYPIPKASDVHPVTPERPVVKRPKMKEWQRQLWLQRTADVDSPSTNPLPPEFPVYIISVEEAHFRKKIKKDIADQQSILDQQAPEASWKPRDQEKTLAKQAWQDAEKSGWQRMTKKAKKTEKK